MEERDYQDKIVAIDADRRRRHDALMESLLTMTQKVHELIKEGYLDEEEIYWWKGAHDSLLVNGTEKLIVLFDVSVPTHANRKQIQDWAIAADLSINLRIIKAREKKNQG